MATDDLVGAVGDELEWQGRTNTIWILTSDNGMTYGEHRHHWKWTPYAARLPLWIAWPSNRGEEARTESSLTSNIDLGPTLARIAGASMPWVDGTAWPQLLLDRPTPTHDAILLSLPNGGAASIPPWWGVRSVDQWLYVEYQKGARELYDLTVDPWMLENVAGQSAYATVQESLAARLLELRAE